MRRYSYFFLGLALVALDQGSKYLAALHTTVFRNYFFAFSLPVPAWLMYPAYAVILGVIVWYVVSHYRNFNIYQKAAWTLILAGSVSNIAERLATGYVKDFIYLFTGVFNLADFYIMLGILLLFFVRI